MAFDVDGRLSAGSGGYCPTSVEKSDPGIMLTFWIWDLGN